MEDQAKRLRELVKNIQKKEAKNKATIITVTSGKGGVGKTSMTVNLALALAEMGKKTVIIDADFGFSNVNILLGANAAHDLGHVIRGEKKLSEVMEDCFEGVQFISGGPGVEELVNIEPERLEDVLFQMEGLEREVDYILFDTGAGIDDNILRLMDASDETILVLTPEPTSITDAFVVLKTAARLKEKPRVDLLINKAQNEKQALATSDNFKRVVEKFLNYPTTLIGYVLSDELITKSIYELVPFVLKYPNSAAAKQIRQIAERLFNGDGFCMEARGFKRFIERFKLKRCEN